MIDFHAERIIRAAESRTQCVRCGAEVHTTDPAHLCKDVKGRLNAYLNTRRQHLRRLIRGLA